MSVFPVNEIVMKEATCKVPGPTGSVREAKVIEVGYSSFAGRSLWRTSTLLGIKGVGKSLTSNPVGRLCMNWIKLSYLLSPLLGSVRN